MRAFKRDDECGYDGISVTFSFHPGPLTPSDVEGRAADMWSDIGFDEPTLARLKRDGLMLDGVRLTGPNPYRISLADSGQIVVAVSAAVIDPAHAEAPLDLWRVHIMKGLRPGSLAA